MRQQEPLRWEDGAQQVTVTGWACKRCGRFWGVVDDELGSEKMARRCCSNDLPCETPGCQNRINRRTLIGSYCKPCQDANHLQRWQSFRRVAWDGASPLFVWDDNADVYIWCTLELSEYLREYNLTPDTVHLVLCEPNNGSTFCMEEHLEGDTPDGELSCDATEIEKAVNDWIATHAPYCWEPTEIAVTAESIRAALNVLAKAETGEAGRT